MEWVKLNRPLSLGTIKKLEEELGINLPRDFIDWYLLYDLPKQQELLVDVDGEPCDIDSFYPIQMMASESKSFFDEDKQLSENGKVLPFAFDSIGSQYCFFYPKNSKTPSTIFFTIRMTMSPSCLMVIISTNHLLTAQLFKAF